MFRCTVMVPHVNAVHWLKGCLDQIDKCRHPEVQHDVIVIDQSDEADRERARAVSARLDVRFEVAERIDAGWPIDLGCRMARGDYFCSLDCDALPTSPYWLYAPIRLIDELGFLFVGTCTWGPDIFGFPIINNFYRVSRTDIAREVSEQVGFLRPQNHARAGYQPNFRGWKRVPCDNGVVAMWYAISQMNGGRLGRIASLPITQVTGKSNKQGVFGYSVADLVYHAVFSYGQDWIEDMAAEIGSQWQRLNDMVMNNGADVAALLAMQRPLQPGEAQNRNSEFISGTFDVDGIPSKELKSRFYEMRE